jgi:activator of 2-hydroxyglutaryl-CoA dehydratase
MKIVGFDCGSTTVKANVLEDGQVLWKDYRRHGTKIADTTLDFFTRMETEAGVTAGEARVYITGSASGPLAPLIGAKQVQEVVAVAAAVETPGTRYTRSVPNAVFLRKRMRIAW